MNTEHIPFVDLKAQYQAISVEVENAISNVVLNTSFVLGKPVSEFESAFAQYCGSRFAVGVDSGTSAIHLALEAFGVGPGDEVITTPNTFIATACAIEYAGATPVLVDVNPDTYTMDPDLLAAAITERTKAIIPVHLYGQPADMDPIMEIANRYGLTVIEDACQAHGARYKERRVGTIGHAAAFSFYPAKNLGAFGDGGIITTDDPEAAHKMLLLRNFGQEVKNVHLISGYNHRLDALQAAILSCKLKYIDRWNAQRYQNARAYTERLISYPILTPHIANYANHVFHLYIIQVDYRDELRDFLSSRNIGTGIHYPIPIHLQPAFEHLGYTAGSFPISEAIADRIVSLPMFPELTLEQIDRICDNIIQFASIHHVEEDQVPTDKSSVVA